MSAFFVHCDMRLKIYSSFKMRKRQVIFMISCKSLYVIVNDLSLFEYITYPADQSNNFSVKNRFTCLEICKVIHFNCKNVFILMF